jgi:hypothetical protein
MPDISKSCDILQGYNFEKDRQATVGFITELTVGGQSLKADQTVVDPTDAAAKKTVNAVAVLSGYSWSSALTAPMHISGQITVENRQTLATLLLQDLTQMEVDAKFAIYEYDPTKKAYYSCVVVETTLKGLLEKRQADLTLSVAEDASTEVQSPLNYAFHFGMAPQPTAQTLTVQTSTTNKIVKAWGLKAGAA